MTVPIFNMTDTWNDAGTNFTAIQMNVTNTASGASSLFFDMQISGSSLFKIDKAGLAYGSGLFGNKASNANVSFSGGTAYNDGGAFIGYGGSHATQANYTQILYAGARIAAGAQPSGSITGFYIDTSNGQPLGFTDGASNNVGNTIVANFYLQRFANQTLGLDFGTSPCTFQVYNTFTDGSNYERGVFDWTTNTNLLTIGTDAAGTGTRRNTQIQGSGFVDIVTFPSGAFGTLRCDGTNRRMVTQYDFTYSFSSSNNVTSATDAGICRVDVGIVGAINNNSLVNGGAYRWLFDISNNLTNCSTLGGII